MDKNCLKHLLPVFKGFVILGIALSLNTVSGAATDEVSSWTLKDATGQEVSLSDYQGKPLILHFWATWCPYCKKVQPGLERLLKQYHADGLEVLGISFREDEGVMPQQILLERGFTFKTLINGDAVAKQYGVKGTPTTFFIDRKGVIIWVTNSSDPDDPKMEEVVRGMIGG